MNTVVTVTSLQGQAWAVNSQGQRRALKAGDQLSAEEMLITAPGAQVSVDFGNNRVLSFFGEQQNLIEDVAQSAPVTAPNVSAQEAVAPSFNDAPVANQGSTGGLPEGHNFVQLVRILEIIEADGFTPVTVARIREVLRPLGMSLPDREFPQDEWREHWAGAREHGAAQGAVRVPSLTVELQGAGPDGVYSPAEIGADGTVTAQVTLGPTVAVGDRLVVKDGQGKVLLDRTVTANDLTQGVSVEVPVLPGQNDVVVTATVTTPEDQSASSSDVKPVDNLPPVALPVPDQTDWDNTPVDVDSGRYFHDQVSGDDLTYSAIGLPPGLSIDPETGRITGTLDKDASQFDSDGDGQPDGKYQVTITATDPSGNSVDSTFTWTVSNPPPVAHNDSTSTAEDTPVSGNVLTGSNNPGDKADIDPDGDPLVVVDFVVDGDPTRYPAGSTAVIPGTGTLVLNPDGSYTFTPEPNWNGKVPDITYSISDGEGGSDDAILQITVTPVNDAPQVNPALTPPNQSSVDAQLIPKVTLDLPNLFNDVDGDTLSYTIAGLPPGLSFDPLTGEITGTPTKDASQGGPNNDGVYTVTITATDPDGGSVDQTFTWTVSNPPPVAMDDSASTAEDTPVSGNVITGSGNPGDVTDTDPDGDTLTVTEFVIGGMVDGAGNPKVFTPGSTPLPVTDGSGEVIGSLIFNPDGSYTFNPAPNWNGQVPDITYSISDGEGGSDDAILQITVTPVNDAPQVNPALTPPNQSSVDAQLIPKVTLDLPNLFNDVDGDTLSYTVAGLPPGLSFDPLTGEITGTPAKDASQGGPNNDGVYTVTITATDPDGESVDQTFTWTVSNPPPVAMDDSASTAEDTPVSGNVLTGSSNPGDVADTDPDGDTLTVTEFVISGMVDGAGDPKVFTPGSTPLPVTDGSGEVIGSLIFNPDGSYTFTPAPNWNGQVPDITYTISDGEGGTDTAVLEITVTPVNDPVSVIITPDHVAATPDANVQDHVVFESGLSNGSSPEVKDTQVNSSFTASVPDGLATTDGISISFTNPDGTPGSTVLTKAQVEALGTTPVSIETEYGRLELNGYSKTPAGEISIDYTYTLEHAPENPTASSNSQDDVFGIIVKDADGDSSSANLTIKIIDDAPSIDALPTLNAQIVVDETTLGTPSGWIDLAGGFTVPNFGADGASLTNSLVYTLEVLSSLSGLVDTASGAAVVLSLNTANGQVEGKTASGDLVFSIEVNADGEVQLTQHRAMVHADGTNPDDSLSLPAGSVVLKATVTDKDGDTDSAQLNIGNKFVFKDDGPSFSAPTTSPVLDEKGLPFGSEPNAGGAAVSTGQVVLGVNFGADNAANGVRDVVFTTQTQTALKNWADANGNSGLTFQLAADGHSIVALKGTVPVFTATLTTTTNGQVTYEVVLHQALTHTTVGGVTPDLILPFDGIKIVDGDGDTTTGSFIVKVQDDSTPSAKVITTPEDTTSVWHNTAADSTLDNVEILVDGSPVTGVLNSDGNKVYDVPYGQVEVNANGQIRFIPDEDYSNHQGSTGFTVKVTDDNNSVTYTDVTVYVTPVADKPGLGGTLDPDTGKEVLAPVSTDEDTAVTLGLHAPSNNDALDQNDAAQNTTVPGDSPERMGEITLTLSGSAVTGSQLLASDGTLLHTFDASGTVKIWLTDVDHPADVTKPAGALEMTQAEYEALKFKPAEHRHENVGLKVTVTSYEVDDNGNAKNADGSFLSSATAEGNTTILVKAVTDDAGLVFDTTKTTGIANLESVTYANSTNATVVMAEDNRFKVNDILSAAFQDLDGSEVRSITITNTTGESIVVNGVTVASGASTTINAKAGAAGQTGGISSFPDINIGAAQNFSGDLNGIKITINAQDKDADGFAGNSSAANGTPEADTSNNSVTLNLQVKPVAGDISILEPVAVDEDSNVAFLGRISLTDTGTGTEIITELSFEVTGFSVAADGLSWESSTATTGNSTLWSMTVPAGKGTTWDLEVVGNKVTIKALGSTNLSDLLDEFVLTPPHHNSQDLTLNNLTVTSVDSNTVGGQPVSSAPASKTQANFVVKVTPVAEDATDSNGKDGGDVTINPNYEYKTAGKEDTWFTLNKNSTVDGSDDNFQFSAGWSNEDTDELTFACLTPELVGGTAGESAIGSQFRFDLGGKTYTYTYSGEPSNIWIPMQALGTVQFKAPQDVSGEFKITVEAITIDYDDDLEPVAPWDPAAPNTSLEPGDHVINGNQPSIKKSNSSVLTQILIEGVADEITMALNGHSRGLEDNVIALDIRANSSDKSEVIDLTIRNIPVGATIYYTKADGSPGVFTATAGNTTLTLDDYNGITGTRAAGPLSIRPPEDFSGVINLKAEAQSRENDVNGDPSTVYELPVEVTVEAVADEAQVTLASTSATWTALIPAGISIEYLDANGVTQTYNSAGTPWSLPVGVDMSSLKLSSSVAQSGDLVLSFSNSSGASKNITIAPSSIANGQKYPLTDDWQDVELAHYSEAALDAGGSVLLSDLIGSVTSKDAVSQTFTDGSEVVTIRISGLADGFTLEGGTQLGNGTGPARVWTIAADQLSSVQIKGPQNFSGKVTFQVQGVTTESGALGGDSLTGPKVDVSFVVTPSAEAIARQSATLDEDQLSNIGFGLIHQNGDTDETLGNVYILQSDLTNANFELYIGNQLLSAVNPPSVAIAGKTYYQLTAAQAQQLAAKGAEHLDGPLGVQQPDGSYKAFDFKYEVTDSRYGSLASGNSDTVLKDGSFSLTVRPTADQIEVSIGSIVGGLGSTSISDSDASDENLHDTASLTAADTVTVNLTVKSPDHDGSEQVTRVIIDGVPDGVTVEGGAMIGPSLDALGNPIPSLNSWVLVYEGNNIPVISGAGGLSLPVIFNISGYAGNLDQDIQMTVQNQDRGLASTTQDTVHWKLVTTFGPGEPPKPPVIKEWSYNDTGAVEDSVFTLGSKVNAEIEISSPTQVNILTVTLTEVPEGVVLNGMTLTVINGVEVWTASVEVQPGQDGQAKLIDLLNSITITPDANSNDNNALDQLLFNARLSTAVKNGGSVFKDIPKEDFIIAVTPQTDPADVVLIAESVAEGQTQIAVSLDVSTPDDGIYGELVGSKALIKVSNIGGNGGTLTLADGTVLTTETVGGESYYVVPLTDKGGSVNLIYTAPAGTTFQPGSVTFEAQVTTKEQGASELTSNTPATANIKVINNGVTVITTPVQGNESIESSKTNAIELTGNGGLSVSLNDNDGSEVFSTIMLSGLPVGFLVYVGASAQSAQLANLSNNAGGDGSTNTWILSSSGGLPKYVSILPPTHWSGTLQDLKLLVSSGEKNAAPLVEEVLLAAVTVNPVANGAQLQPSRSYGYENSIIELNLNASMKDPDVAKSTLADSSTETATIVVSGLGEHAEFYVGQVGSWASLYAQTTWDAQKGTYTIAGLSQDQLNSLAFKQAINAITDQNTSKSGLQIKVDVYTEESAGGAPSATTTKDVDLTMWAQYATNTDDVLLWDGSKLNGYAGNDTVQLRYGENLSGTELSDKLKNIEVLDLSVEGANSITALTAADVFKMTDSNNTLSILGNSDDHVSLGAEWTASGNTYTATYDEKTITLTIANSIVVD